jgi:hypothetical protein
MTTRSTTDYINDWKPRGQAPDRWNTCAEEVREAVLAVADGGRTLKTDHVRGLLNALVHFLDLPGVWDGRAAPDLRALLAPANLDRVVNSAARKAGGRPRGTLRVRRAYLRLVGEAIGSRSARHRHAAAGKPAALVAAAAQKPIPAIVLAGAYFAATPRPNRREPFRGFRVGPNQAAAGTAGDPDASTVAAPATFRALAEVTHLPVKEPAMTSPHQPTKETKRTVGKKQSRRAALARAREVREARAAAAAGPVLTTEPVPDLPEDFLEVVKRYVPNHSTREAWDDNLETAVRLVAGYRPVSVRNTQALCSNLAAFFSWFVTSPSRSAENARTRAPIELAELLAPDIIELFIAQLERSDASKATARTNLRRALGSLNPASVPAKLSYQPVAAPYSPEECEKWRQLALNQPTEARTASLCFIVGLALGAGLAARDMRHLTPNSIWEVRLPDGSKILTVTVEDGERARVVPIARNCEWLIQTGLDYHSEFLHKGDDDLILGKVPDRNNVVSSYHLEAKTAAANKHLSVQVSRLRNTWLLAAMAAPVPLADLLRLAGLTSARTISDLLVFAPNPDPEQVNQVLADLGFSRQSETDTKESA